MASGVRRGLAALLPLAAAIHAAVRRMPPINTAKRTCVRVGAGTDARRIASCNPWVALRCRLQQLSAG